MKYVTVFANLLPDPAQGDKAYVDGFVLNYRQGERRRQRFEST